MRVGVRFDVMSDVYDAMINWEKRLSNEAAFYRGIFEEAKAKSVIDVACGTGRHALLFSSWGLDVEGADISQEMLSACRKHPGAEKVTWSERSFSEAAPPRDVVVCAGNSLAMVENVEETGKAIDAMAKSANRAIVLHVVNMHARPDGPVIWDKCRRIKLHGVEHLVNKGIHRSGQHGYVDFILTPLEGTSEQVVTRCVKFLSLDASWLQHRLHDNGFKRIRLFGGYGGSSFDVAKSPDLVIEAFKG